MFHSFYVLSHHIIRPQETIIFQIHCLSIDRTHSCPWHPHSPW